jgi:hypothetical protein
MGCSLCICKSVEERRNRETHIHARLAGPNGAGWGTGARRVHEWSVEIQLKASQVCGFLLSLIFVTSPCLIRFNRDRSSRLRDVVTLPFIFVTSLCLIRFNRDRPSRLRDVVTLNVSSL